MSLYVSPSGWYKLQYPAVWEHDDENDMVAFYEPKHGVGTVQISAYSVEKSENASPRTLLLEYLGQHNIEVVDENIALKTQCDKIIAQCEYISDRRYWAIWVIRKFKKMLFVTYNCNEEEKDIERSDVERLVNSIDFIDRDDSD